LRWQAKLVGVAWLAPASNSASRQAGRLRLNTTIFSWVSYLSFTSVPSLGGGFLFTDGIKQDVDLGTVRVKYRFGGLVVAKF
jgi:hypothetical protein